MVSQSGLSTAGRGCTGVVPGDCLHSVFARDGDWYVIHTRTRQERALCRALEAREVACFLPVRRTVRFQARRKVLAETPLFSNYLFLKGSVEDAYLADRTGRVANILRCPDQKQIQWELENVRRALAGEADLQPYPYLKRGVRVQVRSGPFRCVQGWVEERSKRERLILRIETLGRAVSFEVDGSLLEVVG